MGILYCHRYADTRGTKTEDKKKKRRNSTHPFSFQGIDAIAVTDRKHELFLWLLLTVSPSCSSQCFLLVLIFFYYYLPIKQMKFKSSCSNACQLIFRVALHLNRLKLGYCERARMAKRCIPTWPYRSSTFSFPPTLHPSTRKTGPGNRLSALASPSAGHTSFAHSSHSEQRSGQTLPAVVGTVVGRLHTRTQSPGPDACSLATRRELVTAAKF